MSSRERACEYLKAKEQDAEKLLCLGGAGNVRSGSRPDNNAGTGRSDDPPQSDGGPRIVCTTIWTAWNFGLRRSIVSSMLCPSIGRAPSTCCRRGNRRLRVCNRGCRVICGANRDARLQPALCRRAEQAIRGSRNGFRRPSSEANSWRCRILEKSRFDNMLL